MKDLLKNIPNGDEFSCIQTQQTEFYHPIECYVYNNFATQRYLNGKNNIYYISFQIINGTAEEFPWLRIKDDFESIQWDEELDTVEPENLIFLQPVLLKKNNSDFKIALLPKIGTQTRYKFARQFEKFKGLVTSPSNTELISGYMHSVIDILIAYDEKHYVNNK